MSHFFVFFFHSFPYTKRPIFWKVEFVLDAFYTKRSFFCGHYCDSKVILYPDLSVSLVELNFVTHSNWWSAGDLVWWLQDTTRPNNGHFETFFTCSVNFLFRKFSSGKMKLQPVTLSEEIFPLSIPISFNCWANTLASKRFFLLLGTDGIFKLIGNLT